MEAPQTPGSATQPTPELPKIPPQLRMGTARPRLTLQQVGRVLGTNDRGRITREIQDVIFIAIDCEAYEFAQHKTTEIGVSILDTAAIANTSPGPKAAAWLETIKSEHFRIKEFAHLVNKRWVKGDPDSFSFGTSTFIGKSEASRVMTDIFSPSAREARRNVVLVGHGLKNEVGYLKNLHFDLMNAPNVVAIVDTSSIGPGKGQLGLKKLCEAVGMEPQSLHNAGNDAAYTLRAMILAAILHDSSLESFTEAFRRQVAVRKPQSAANGSWKPRNQGHNHARAQASSAPQQPGLSTSTASNHTQDRSQVQRPAKPSHEERKALWVERVRTQGQESQK